MKNFLVLISLSAALLVSCTGGNSYELETFYSKDKAGGDSTLTSDKDNIHADSDSAAFIKAQEKFNSLKSDPDDDKGMPVKFTVRNSAGVIITEPGLHRTGEAGKQMYPNQKP